LNKNTKIWINYWLGALISAVLLWSLWGQLRAQFAQQNFQYDPRSWNTGFLLVALLLLPVNLAVETSRWYLLISTVHFHERFAVFRSVLAGIAISLVTPNRIGEYPARILYLSGKKPRKAIAACIVAIFAQFSVLFGAGLIGLVYFTGIYPGVYTKLILAGCCIILLFIIIIFFSFGKLLGKRGRGPVARRIRIYGNLLSGFSRETQLKTLGLSAVRFLVIAAQYLALLYWTGIEMQLWKGLLTGLLFFWSIAVLPSFALAELGIRGKVSVFLFAHLTSDVAGVLTATVALWFINLILPAVAGSLLFIKTRMIK